MQIIEFTKNETAVAHLAQQIAQDLHSAIQNHGKASLLVSGGKSPIALFNQLSQLPLEWQKVSISLVDDRWLAPNHSDSNELLVRTHLLVGKASKATFIPLVGHEANAEAGLAGAITRVEPLATGADVLVLGMGEDGHTASIFPCSPQVGAALDLDNKQSLIVTTPTTAPYQRISLTLNQILAAKSIYLPLVGTAKIAVFEQARQIEDYQKMPIGAVIAQHPALNVLMCRPA